MEPEKFYDLVNKEISKDTECWEATTSIEDIIHLEIETRIIGFDSLFVDDPDVYELLDKGFYNLYDPNDFAPYMTPDEQDQMRWGY